ncbi:MAG: tRNA (adenosine(37)-N6)-threonylcarbamoyltransferase complex ATPase subunit type 1 TsaE [Candidatus Liptonbacteria bacterium]|nr:tRNA (adenosine(37)-N6)-threonylcarbamoyltransferase complex ATPase subunit type 1 TsaE [Candidatus Liptonbacteria bacterium]
MKNYTTSSSEETKKLAAKFAQKVVKLRPRPHAVVIGFVGDLGAGKTTFVQGFLKALGARSKVTSPTFVLIKRHPVGHKGLKYAYHIDSYRLKHHRDLEIFDFKKTVSDPRNIILIEWAEKVKKLLPKDTIWVKFSHGKKENERKIKCRLA